MRHARPDTTDPRRPRARGRAPRTPVALAVAGSDSSGGAGVQADLKAFARCGVHGACALTAVTAQSAGAVHALHPLPARLVRAQIAAVLDHMTVDAVKLGMLPNARVALAVAHALQGLPSRTPVVIDPVLSASSGAQLADAGALRVLIERLLPRATVLTPNVPEARAIVKAAHGRAQRASPHALVRELLRLGARAVVLTGGHRADNAHGQVVDLFACGTSEIVEIAGPRVPGGAGHGSGCTHAALIAAQLALAQEPLAAARRARALAGEAIAHDLRDLGGAPGAVDVLGLERVRRASAPR